MERSTQSSSAGAATSAPEADAHTWRTISFGGRTPWSVPQLALGLLTVASAAVFLQSLYLASGGFDAIAWGLVLVPLVFLRFAGSGAPLAFWGLLLVAWFLLTPEGSFSPWSVPAGLALLVGHASSALSATTPPAGGFSRRQVRRWLGPVLLAGLAAPAVALLAGPLSGATLEASPAAYVIGLGGLAIGVFLLRTEPPLSSE